MTITDAIKYLEESHITFLDEYIKETSHDGKLESNIPVTERDTEAYHVIEDYYLTDEYAAQLSAEYEAVPLFNSIQDVDGQLKAQILFDDGQEKWITLLAKQTYFFTVLDLHFGYAFGKVTTEEPIDLTQLKSQLFNSLTSAMDLTIKELEIDRSTSMLAAIYDHLNEKPCRCIDNGEGGRIEYEYKYFE